MRICLWGIIGVLSTVIAVLVVKIYNLQRDARKIGTDFAERLITDTNILIDISSHDRYMRELADTINRELRKFRVLRHRFLQGDMELKNAVTNISHDLRTPLTAICGYLDLLEQEEKSEAACRYLGVIRNRTEMMKQLTEELFRYSVILSTEERLCLEEVNVNRILEESIVAAYEELTKRNIEPVISMTEQTIVRNLNKGALFRVFGNLINNAVKYSDGDLRISLLDSGEILFQNTAGRLNGVQVGQLFDRFFSVETAGNSTGLGLSIAQTLVEQMNGIIAAEYKEKQLRIRIVFPEGGDR